MRPNSAEAAEHGGERIEEHDLDVEDDERHRHQIELHREALGRLVLGHDAALVRRLLRRRSGRCGASSCEATNDKQHERDDQPGHHQDRQVVGHWSATLPDRSPAQAIVPR